MFAGKTHVCIDPTIQTPGDGSTPETALSTLPAPSALHEETVYWIRRTPMTITWGTGVGAIGVHEPNIYFIGMPLPTDSLWNACPAAIRDAWGADASEYATVRFGEPSLSVRFHHNTGGGGVHRIRFLVPNRYFDGNHGDIGFLCWSNHDHSSSGYAQSHVKAAFMTHCEWRVEGVDLDQEGYTGANETMPNSWFSFHFHKSVRISHCRFVYPGHYGYYNYYNYCGFYFRENKSVSVTDCDSWSGSGTYNYDRPSLFYFTGVMDLTFTDNRHRYVIQQNNSQEAYLGGWIGVGGGNHTRRLQRLDCRIGRFFEPGSPPRRLVLKSNVINASTHSSYLGWDRTLQKPTVIDSDITVDMTPCWESHDYDFSPTNLRGNYPIYLGTDNTDNNAITQNVTGYTRNITAIVPREGGIGRANMPYALYLERPNTHYQGGTIKNITAKNIHGFGLGFTGSSFSYYDWSCGHPPIRFGHIEGGLILRNAALATVDLVEVKRPHQFLHIEGSTVYIEQVVADREAWNNHQTFVNANGSRLVINKTNIPVLWPDMTHWGRTGLIVNSDSGCDGRWKGSNGYFHGENWNTRREGGSVSSIKLWGRDDARLPLQVGFEGFKNFRIAAPAAGRYLLRVYGAHKMFSEANIPKLPWHVVVKATVKRTVDNPFTGAPEVVPFVYDSQTDGGWEADTASVWLNDEGVTGVVCTIPIEIPAVEGSADRFVDVRVEYDWYDAQGYFNLDTYPLLEAVDGGIEPLMMRAPNGAPVITLDTTDADNGEAAPAGFSVAAMTADLSTTPETVAADLSLYFVTSGDKYHLPDCPYAKTGVAMTPEQILAREGSPCKRCNPPVL